MKEACEASDEPREWRRRNIKREMLTASMPN
jgi:hypothetical protein